MANTWFPNYRESRNGWRLDVISLLAVIGESSIGQNAQSITSSKLSLLPRLVPAPHSLLTTSRPSRLPAAEGTVIGVHNGNQVEGINYFAEVMHRFGELEQYEFRVYDVRWRGERGRDRVRASEDRTKQASPASTGEKRSSQGPKRPSTDDSSSSGCSVADNARLEAGRTTMKDIPALIGPKKLSPSTIVTVLSCLLSISILVWAALIKDGVALIAISLLSIASTFICYGHLWDPHLAVRPSSSKVPPGDVIIRTRQRALVVIKCNEEVARELYIGSEYCKYAVKQRTFQAVSGVGTLFVMVGVVLLGNCTWTMQVVIGVTYVLLNGVYWTIGLIPKRAFWDLNRYEVECVTPEWMQNAHLETHGERASLTRTLWYTIHVTKHSHWARVSNTAPRHSLWDKWLDLALENVKDANWPAVVRKDELFRDSSSDNKEPP